MQHEFKLGILTLGRAPRTDVEPTFRSILGQNVEFIQRGGLDGLSESEIAELHPEDGQQGIETCVLENSVPVSVYVSRQKLLERLIKAALELRKKCSIFFLLCSGRFPELKEAVPEIIEPAVNLRSVVAERCRNSHLCIIGPESDMPEAKIQWQPYATSIYTAAASPYEGLDALTVAVAQAKKMGAEYLLLDDMGFTEKHSSYVQKISGLPTINATVSTAEMLRDIIEKAS
jgi:protein AroM